VRDQSNLGIFLQEEERERKECCLLVVVIPLTRSIVGHDVGSSRPEGAEIICRIHG
jgi:hypothetical protein